MSNLVILVLTSLGAGVVGSVITTYGSQAREGPSAAGGMMVLLDYWIPYRLAWLRPQRKSGGNAEDAEACRRVAARLEVSPADLNRAQYFASSIWLRLVALSAILFLAQALSGLFFPKGHQRDLVLNIALSWLFLLAISAMQAGGGGWGGGAALRALPRAVCGAVRRGAPAG